MSRQLPSSLRMAQQRCAGALFRNFVALRPGWKFVTAMIPWELAARDAHSESSTHTPPTRERR